MQAASILEEDAGSEVEQVVRRNLAKELHLGKDCQGTWVTFCIRVFPEITVKKSWQEKLRG